MEGWAGAVAGGDGIRPLEWDSVGSILQRGGTIIGTARSAEFRERAGQLAAAATCWSTASTGSWSSAATAP